MSYYYDLWGWASAEVIEGRSTELPPPTGLADGFQANWTGTGWSVLPYLPIDPAPIRTALVQAVYDAAAARLSQITRDYSFSEQVTWPVLETECRAYQGGAQPGPLMAAEIAQGARTADQLAAVVVGLADTLRPYLAAIKGIRERTINQINSMSPSDLVQFVVGEIGWP